MVYITVRQSPRYHKMTLNEFLFDPKCRSELIGYNHTNTRTYTTEVVDIKLIRNFDLVGLLHKLRSFNETTQKIREVDRHELYTTFHIPKRSGGLRKIDAPDNELKFALRRLKSIFEDDFKALYHTSAFAYIKDRCTIDAIKRHQNNESKWFGKYDLSNFFGSITLDYAMDMFSMIFPFSELVKYPEGYDQLKTALSLAFLDGGLPQGTPISPLITNIIMIPIDHMLSNTLRDFDGQKFIYTRYADDFIISSRHEFDVKSIENIITDTLKAFGAPFSLNSKKTRYGSSAGSNWNLGVMLNKDNQITIGHRNKKQFKSMIVSYVKDKLNGTNWDINDVQILGGKISYYRSVEGDNIDKIISYIGEKLNVDVMQMIKNDLSA